MNEVTQSDIELVTNAFKKYFAHLLQTQNFNAEELKNFTEPAFINAGYRDTPKLGEPLNLLIIHDAAIGDFVLQSGAIREFRRLYPDAYITLMVNGGSLPLAEHCPYVNEIVENKQDYDATNFNALYYWNLSIAQKLLARRYHICYAFVHRPNTPLLAYMSGAYIRMAHKADEVLETFVLAYEPSQLSETFGSNFLLKSTLENLMTELISMYRYGSHVVDTHFSFVDDILKAPVQNRELELWYTPLDLADAKNFLRTARKPIYAISVGGRESRKHFPPERYAELIKKILAEENVTFVILGGGKIDADSAQILRKNLSEEIFSKYVIDLTNKTTYRQSAAILTLCDMYIGNDTGIMHVAAAAKCPILTPNCFPADLPTRRADYVKFFSPYHVPSVTVQPAHALPECAVNKPYIQYGCRSHVPHCITQISADDLFHGYKRLVMREE